MRGLWPVHWISTMQYVVYCLHVSFIYFNMHWLVPTGTTGTNQRKLHIDMFQPKLKHCFSDKKWLFKSQALHFSIIWDSHTHFISVYSYDVQMELRRLSVLWDADQSPNHRAAVVGPSTHVTLGASAAWQCSGLTSCLPRVPGCADAASNVVTIVAARVRVPILH